MHNASDTMMIIPREQHMVRFYVRLHDSGFERHQHDTAIFNEILARIRKILAPYRLDFGICDWWSSYRISQKLATNFSDSSHRVFLAGDAVHTHSSKAGQGMNVSIQNAWNLGWKLAAVVKRQASPDLLRTYEVERRPVAQRLLSFDKKVLGCFRSFCHESNGHGKKKTLEATTDEEHSSASGIEVTYAGLGPRSALDILSSPEMAPGVKLGRRIGDLNVVRHADGFLQPSHRIFPADGRWRAIVFSGDITQVKQTNRLEHVAAALTKRKTILPEPLALGVRAECDAILIHASSREEVNFMDVPLMFRPWRKSLGWDYEKVFVDHPGYQVISIFRCTRDWGSPRLRAVSLSCGPISMCLLLVHSRSYSDLFKHPKHHKF